MGVADSILVPWFCFTTAYYNEAAMDLIEWQDLFWGSNYARLLQIKRGLDPMHVFNCRQCVGSEDGF
jgi:hypothetical protein